MAIGRTSSQPEEKPSGPDEYVLALAREYRSYQVAGLGGRLLMVSEELARLGYSVDKSGALVDLDATPRRPRKENAAAKPAPERAAPKD